MPTHIKNFYIDLRLQISKPRVWGDYAEGKEEK
jgi:hypothetical protein